MADDIYADEVTITIHDRGVVLTLVRAEPVAGGTAGPREVPLVICGRLRLSHGTAEAMAAALSVSLADYKRQQNAPKH